MKVSFITTVFNEEKTIETFLKSVVKQSRLPDEVVIVDGGSSDGTREKISLFATRLCPAPSGAGLRSGLRRDKRKMTFKIMERKGASIAQGRNEAIRKATGEIVVASDGGCILEKHWLEEIVKPFAKKEVDVVSGFYLPTGKSVLQKLLGLLTSVPLNKVNQEDFLPSSRSIAFKITAWERVGGYPEDISSCEDLVFAIRLKKFGFMFKFAPQAVVYWEQDDSIIRAVKKFFEYSGGDGMAGKESPHFKKHLFKLGILGGLGVIGVLGGLKIVGIFLLGLFSYKALKLTFKIKKIQVFPMALVLLPILSLTVIAGFLSGRFKGCLKEVKGW